MAGWIKIYRALMEKEFYKMKPFSMGQAWIDLLLLAAYEDMTVLVRGNEVEVKRGQIALSVRDLADRWGWSRTKVSHFLSHLESQEKSLSFEKNRGNVTNLITILNYDKFQECSEDQKAIKKTIKKAIPEAISPIIIKKEDKEIYTPTFAGAYARTHVGEQGNETPPQAPPQDWRNLTSAFKATLGFDPDAIAEYKRKLISEELSIAAGAIGMPKEAQEMFLVKWCEHNPGSEMLRADYEQPFNIKDRATQFMSWWKKHEHRDRDKEREERLNVNAKWGR